MELEFGDWAQSPIKNVVRKNNIKINKNKSVLLEFLQDMFLQIIICGLNQKLMVNGIIVTLLIKDINSVKELEIIDSRIFR